ncbi:MAG: AAA family ATPase [Solirubrobacterales bacterium]
MDHRIWGVKLIGRDTEFARLEAALSDDRTAAVTVHGDPGIGKTRLLAELAARADEGRSLVLEGCADEVEADVPFAVFRDAMDDYVASMHPRELAAAAELARVLPSARQEGESEPEAAPAGEERYRSHQAVRSLLGRLALRRDVVLILDDVQWADPASLELLGHLLRHPPPGRVLTAMGHRGSNPPPALEGALAAAQRAGRAERISLTELGRDDSERLLGEDVDEARRATILAECGGNPFYLEQLSRSTPPPGVGERTSEPGLPATIAASITAEIRELDEGDAALLRGAAVVGEPFEVELAASAADLGEAQALDAVDTLASRELLRPTDSPRRFRFRHPILRRAVYESTPEGGASAPTSARRSGADQRPPSARAAAPRALRPGRRRSGDDRPDRRRRSSRAASAGGGGALVRDRHRAARRRR